MSFRAQKESQQRTSSGVTRADKESSLAYLAHLVATCTNVPAHEIALAAAFLEEQKQRGRDQVRRILAAGKESPEFGMAEKQTTPLPADALFPRSQSNPSSPSALQRGAGARFFVEQSAPSLQRPVTTGVVPGDELGQRELAFAGDSLHAVSRAEARTLRACRGCLAIQQTTEDRRLLQQTDRTLDRFEEWRLQTKSALKQLGRPAPLGENPPGTSEPAGLRLQRLRSLGAVLARARDVLSSSDSDLVEIEENTLAVSQTVLSKCLEKFLRRENEFCAAQREGNRSGAEDRREAEARGDLAQRVQEALAFETLLWTGKDPLLVRESQLRLREYDLKLNLKQFEEFDERATKEKISAFRRNLAELKHQVLPPLDDLERQRARRSGYSPTAEEEAPRAAPGAREPTNGEEIRSALRQDTERRISGWEEILAETEVGGPTSSKELRKASLNIAGGVGGGGPPGGLGVNNKSPVDGTDYAVFNETRLLVEQDLDAARLGKVADKRPVNEEFDSISEAASSSVLREAHLLNMRIADAEIAMHEQVVRAVELDAELRVLASQVSLTLEEAERAAGTFQRVSIETEMKRTLEQMERAMRQARDLGTVDVESAEVVYTKAKAQLNRRSRGYGGEQQGDEGRVASAEEVVVGSALADGVAEYVGGSSSSQPMVSEEGRAQGVVASGAVAFSVEGAVASHAGGSSSAALVSDSELVMERKGTLLAAVTAALTAIEQHPRDGACFLALENALAMYLEATAMRGVTGGGGGGVVVEPDAFASIGIRSLHTSAREFLERATGISAPGDLSQSQLDMWSGSTCYVQCGTRGQGARLGRGVNELRYDVNELCDEVYQRVGVGGERATTSFVPAVSGPTFFRTTYWTPFSPIRSDDP